MTLRLYCLNDMIQVGREMETDIQVAGLNSYVMGKSVVAAAGRCVNLFVCFVCYVILLYYAGRWYWNADDWNGLTVWSSG